MKISFIHHLLSTIFYIWSILFHLCSSPLQVILKQKSRDRILIHKYIISLKGKDSCLKA